MDVSTSVGIADIEVAQSHDGDRRQPHAGADLHSSLSDETGREIVLKAESLQRTGAVQDPGRDEQGGLARPGPLPTGSRPGSAGNHAQALAFAARHAGVPCEIFVPSGAPITKIEACQAYGARVVEFGHSLEETMAAAVERKRPSVGMAFCHPFDDPAVVAGQGTLGLELMEDVQELACVVIPLGGGGLASGLAIAVKSLRPDVRVIGVQAERCAPYAGQEPSTGPIVTLADGIAVKRPGQLDGPRPWSAGSTTSSPFHEDAIADAMVFLDPPCQARRRRRRGCRRRCGAVRAPSTCPPREPRASSCPAATSTSGWCLD